ncbi:dioxygenase family protein [Nocardioides flavescens]|uniref:Intradiol ring-cleavage dioxygenases domain-containing protein n=1 Tax=Nocardioides flavescens TaxID=2691959 RepID=A0A6L7EPM2_9ACTN|nr:hypothetical protein [Nocardioides flavescens]MXG89317.1 hypothetical protein [Nocardioides flavescens]
MTTHHPRTRRAVLRASAVTGAAAAAAVVAVRGLAGSAVAGVPTASSRLALAATTGCATLTPEETQGPYWIDERLRRSDIRADSETGAVQGGVPLTLTIRLQDAGAGCAPQTGAYVDIWHCSAQGTYSDVSANGTVGQDWLRGYQVSDADGAVTFTTVYPGWYTGRTVHIHLRIRSSLDSSAVDFTSQIYFDDTVNDTVMASTAYRKSGTRTRNASDGIYDAVNQVTPVGSVAAGYTATFTALLDFGDGTAGSSGTTDSSTGTSGSSDSGSGGTALVRAELAGTTVAATGRGRVLQVRLRTRERLTGRVRLVRHDDVLAHRRWGWLTKGAHTLRLRVPRDVAAGPARVVLTLADRDGNVRTVRRRVDVPRA